MATILLIDDEEIVLNSLINILKRAGHTPLPYSDGTPALAEADFEAIDVVLTNMEMPTSGERVIRTIRSQGLDIPIIVLSGLLAPGDTDRLLALGVDWVLLKPCKIDILLKAVDCALHNKEHQPASFT